MKMLVKYGDERLTIPQAAKRIGISVCALNWRLRKGWPKEQLFAAASFKHRHGPRGPKSVEAPPRSNVQLRQVMREYVSPFHAAADGQITAEEYLKLEKLDE